MESRERRVNERRAVVTEAAAEWLLRLQTGEPSHALRAEFVDWLRESPVHVAEFLRVSQVHGVLQEFSQWAAVPGLDAANVIDATSSTDARFERNGSTAVSARDARPHRRRWPLITALAASVGIMALGLAWLIGALAWRSIETETAERRQIALADGSVVDVSPETKLKVRFGESERRVLLLRGDALFSVTTDAGRPFIVEAEHAIVRVVGTAFGVERRRDSSVVVTVAEGRVAVARSDGGAIGRTFPNLPFAPTPVALQEVALRAGQQVEVPNIGEIGNVREVDSRRELAWAEGRLVFENTTLGEVTRQFNRYNVIQIRLSDRSLSSRTISGVFNASDPESFVAFLETVTQVEVARNRSDEITIIATGEEASR